MKKKSLVLITILLLMTTLVGFANTSYEEYFPHATVLSSQTVKTYEKASSGFDGAEQTLTIRIEDGLFKGEEVVIPYTVNFDGPYATPFLYEGDKIVLYVTVDAVTGKRADIQVFSPDRSQPLFLMGGMAALLILIIGGMKGFKSLIGLVITFGSIFIILIPQILSGANPLMMTILVASVVTLLTMLIVGGFNHKSYAAILGTILGIIIAGLLAYMTIGLTKVNGFTTEESVMLFYSPVGELIDMKGILLSGILISSLGAIMDVSMSIASSIYEVHSIDDSLSIKALVTSGMNVGKDIMGTMSNTLILAFTGGAMPMILLSFAYNNPTTKLLNMNHMTSEIIRALSGTIGLVATVPLTAIITSFFLKKFTKKKA